MVVAVEELEVEFDGLFASQNAHNPFPMLCRLFRYWLDRLQTVSDSLEKLLRGGLGQVERNLVGGQDLVFCRLGSGLRLCQLEQVAEQL